MSEEHKKAGETKPAFAIKGPEPISFLLYYSHIKQHISQFFTPKAANSSFPISWK